MLLLAFLAPLRSEVAGGAFRGKQISDHKHRAPPGETRRGPPQQLLKNRHSDLMCGRPPAPLDSFQIELATLAQSRENHLQQGTQFPCHLFLDRLGRFLSLSPDSPSEIGRKWQICSFTSSNS